MLLERLYFDYNATTPMDKEVAAAMQPYLGERFGNPSSVHALGREAKAATEQARQQVAALIDASPEEIVFTSGGTEAINLAILGTVTRHKGKRVITCQVEHAAGLNSCAYLARLGFEVTYLPVDGHGLVEPEQLAAALTPDTSLVSIMLANNELGTIQPVQQLVKIAKQKGVLFHTDAVQAAGKIPVRVDELGVDLLSLSGHKMYGPKGIGALYVRAGIQINPQLHGGQQERQRRAGTENVAGIVGLGAACQLAKTRLMQDTAHITRLSQTLWDKLNRQVEGVRLNGHPQQRLPGTLNLSFDGVNGEALLINLDLEGIAVSAGSACTAGSLEPSHVLLALGLSEEQARSGIRISLGRDNTLHQIETLAATLSRIVTRLRSTRTSHR
jgi:cysteine desulfurase